MKSLRPLFIKIVIIRVQDEDGVPNFSAETRQHEVTIAWMQQRFIEPFKLTGKPLFRYDLVKMLF